MNIGFYLLDVDMSDKYRIMLQAINNLCILRPTDNIVVFNNQFDAIDINQKYYILHLSHAKFFKGILFVNGTKAALLTNSFPCPTQQIIYMNTPEWADHPSLPYTVWANIYLNKNIEILTDNPDTYHLTNICWKKPLPLIESFNAEALNNVIQKI